jgi:UDPglucose 6-dehydrogenase
MTWLPGSMTRIAIVGTGHVGLATAVAFSEWGHEVVGADTDRKIIANLQAGRTTHYEPGLPEALAKCLAGGRLSFTTDVEDAARHAEAEFISVGTPSKKDGSIDLRYVRKAAQTVGSALGSIEGYRVVVVKSTVLPGTTEGVVRPAVEKTSGKKAGRDFGLAVSPEFLREGSAVDDAMHPDRIVVGGIDEKSIESVDAIYASFDCLRMRTDLRTAEMVKYATNAFLATKVSFANELANLCDAFGGLNVDKVVEGMGLDPRINPRFLKAGLGFGGSCLPKDLRAIATAGEEHGYSPRLLKASLDVNERQPFRAIWLAEKAVGSLKGKRVAILGLSFKGGTDDLRDSRATPLANALLDRGAQVVAYDPMVGQEFRNTVPNVEIAKNLAGALASSEVCIVHNDWPQWRALTAADFSSMKTQVVIDARRILDRQALEGVRLVVLGG